MKLHEDKKQFQEAVRFTAQQMGILDIYVEKDYWVCYALKQIFSSPVAEYSIFKGGTALSKCYKVIERFSEDIDLVVIKSNEETPNQLKNKIKKISEVVNEVLPEIPISGVTQKMGMNRKTAHSYSRNFEGSFGQIRDVIIVEASWLGYFEPNEKRQIRTFITEMMEQNHQQEIIKEFCLEPFEVSVLNPKRTFCEKIMSLVRFSYTENPIQDLRGKIRHIYDLHQLLKNKEIITFFESSDFPEMLEKVRKDDVLSYKNNNNWLSQPLKNALIFKNLEEVWKELSNTYNTDFKHLVYGSLPKEEEVISTLHTIKKRIENYG